MARRKASSGSAKYRPDPRVMEELHRARFGPESSTSDLPSGLPSKQHLIDVQLAGERAGREAAHSAFEMHPDDKDFETIVNVGDAIDTACQVAQRIARREIEKKLLRYEGPEEKGAFLAGANWSVDRCLESICDADRTSPCAVDENREAGLLGFRSRCRRG